MNKLTKKERRKYRKEFGELLKRWRKEQRLTQEELGVSLGLHQAALSRIEHGYQSLSVEHLMWIENQYDLLLLV